MEAIHIKGANKILADALSWNNLLLIQSLYPQADKEAFPIPESLLNLLIISMDLQELWSSIIRMAYSLIHSKSLQLSN